MSNRCRRDDDDRESNEGRSRRHRDPEHELVAQVRRLKRQLQQEEQWRRQADELRRQADELHSRHLEQQPRQADELRRQADERHRQFLEELREVVQMCTRADKLHRQADERCRLLEQQCRQVNGQIKQRRQIAQECRQEMQLRRGTFYASIDQVFAVQNKPYNRRHRDALKRESIPIYQSRHVAANEFQITREGAMNSENLVANEPSRARTSHTGTQLRAEVWPITILGEHSTIDSHVVHLLPAAPSHASLWHHVATWAMALEDENNWDVQQRLIHGVSRPNHDRTPHAGIKHFVANKIRLRSEATYFDHHPCVLIIPILSLNEVKGWNGEGYSAIILVGNSSDINVTQVSTQIGLTMPVTEPGEIAERAEIRTARALLESFLCGLASSFDDDTPLGMTDDQKRAWEALAMQYRTAMPKQVIVPILKRGYHYHGVRKVTFEAHSAGVGHPAPDPMLVVAKAAAVWSRRQDRPLLAGGLVGDEDDRSSLSVLAEEQWLQQRQESLRPQTWEDLARGLHQENGYQESIGRM